MSDTLYEYYNVNDNSTYGIWGNNWQAQTFTIGTVGANESHNITSVKLKMYREGNPGILTVGIRAVDGAGKPTGADLTSGTINANAFTLVPPGLWYEITLTPYLLLASTKYAIVCRISGGDADNEVRWRTDVGAAVYLGGQACSSVDAGVNWSTSTEDNMFEEYGKVGLPMGLVLNPAPKGGIGRPAMLTGGASFGG